MSSHHEQLSTSEQEKMTVYRAEIPNFYDVKASLIHKDRHRSSSMAMDEKINDVQRHLLLFNRPFRPKNTKHKANKSENASQASDEMNELKYYKNQQDGQENDEEEYPEYILDGDLNDQQRGRRFTKDDSKNPAFVSSRSPSLRD